MNSDLIGRDVNILGGVAVFTGTRVPVRTLTDFLGAGETIEAFLDAFPTVRRGQVAGLLDAARARLAADPA